jgi:Domain of unknown function (DUF4192)
VGASFASRGSDSIAGSDPCDFADLIRPVFLVHVAAPASLLAFCAWQNGDGALANVALDRALADNPRYSMALLLRQVLDSGAPPSMAVLPMTPEEVAAAYDEAEGAPPESQGRRQTSRSPRSCRPGS